MSDSSWDESASPTPPTMQPTSADPRDQLREFLRAIHVMKMYAAEEGIAIPAKARAAVAAVVPAESALAGWERGGRTGPAMNKLDLKRSLADAMTAHALLSAVVAPATPDSIQYTQPPVSVLDFRKRQAIIFSLTVIAIVSIVLYLCSLILSSILAEPSARANALFARVEAFSEQVGELEALHEDIDNFGAQIDAQIRELESLSTELDGAAAAFPVKPPRTDLNDPDTGAATRSIGDNPEPPATAWPRDVIQVALIDLKNRPTSAPIALGKIRDAVAGFKAQFEAARYAPQWPLALLDHLKNVFAAMLGAAFYTLYTANSYIVQRTFDRRYTTHYIVRFVLGVVAGVILANFGGYVLTGTLTGNAEAPGIVLAQTLLALIGGYSADAVNAIFTRVAETLTTMVRGDRHQQAAMEAEAEVAKTKMDAAAQVTGRVQAELGRLQSLLADAVRAQAPEELIAAIRRQLEELSQNEEN